MEAGSPAGAAVSGRHYRDWRGTTRAPARCESRGLPRLDPTRQSRGCCVYNTPRAFHHVVSELQPDAPQAPGQKSPPRVEARRALRFWRVRVTEDEQRRKRQREWRRKWRAANPGLAARQRRDAIADNPELRERERQRAKKYRASKAYQTPYAKALAEGNVEAFRERMRENARRAMAAKSKKLRGQRGPGTPKPIVEIPPIVTPAESAGYPNLGEVIDGYASRFIQRHKHEVSGRQAMRIFDAARASLPARPTEHEYRAWLAALHRGEHGVRLGPSTLNRYIRSLRSLYEYARLRRGPWHNPMVDVAEFKDARLRALPLNERNLPVYYQRAMDVLDDARERGFMAVLRFTGIREQEVLGLQAGDIDTSDPRAPRMWLDRQRDADTFEAETLKHVRQRRPIPIHPELLSRLREVLRLGPPEVKMGQVWMRDRETRVLPFLFPFRSKQMLKLAKKMKALLPDGDWPDGIAFHAFRHGWALEARKKARMTVDEISDWLGHASTEVTRVYLRSLLGEENEFASLERLFAAQAGEPMPVEERQARAGESAQRLSTARARQLAVVEGSASRRSEP